MKIFRRYIMKKILFFIIALVFAVCSVSCAKASEEIELNTLGNDGIRQYLSIDLTFSDFDFAKSTSSIHKDEYYIMCTATVIVKPVGDYSFENASVVVHLRDNDIWRSARKSSSNTIGATFTHEWFGRINLDKNGYGKATIFMTRYSDTYEYVHPSTIDWMPYLSAGEGTIIVN